MVSPSTKHVTKESKTTDMKLCIGKFKNCGYIIDNLVLKLALQLGPKVLFTSEENILIVFSFNPGKDRFTFNRYFYYNKYLKDYDLL